MDGEDAVLVRLTFLFTCLLLVGCGSGDDRATVGPPDTGLPAKMLWTWERHEDLSFLLDEDGVGAAALVATVDLAADGLRVRPNGNSLRLPAKTPRIAVVRIENLRGRPVPAQLEPDTRRRLLDVLVRHSQRLDASGLQIDFDALASQRRLYAGLLTALRPELPAGHSLGITALASWCVGDPWLDELPAGTLDYAVPMLFRMGRDAERIRAFVDAGRELSSPLCRRDVGLSADEPWPRVGAGKRRWLFSPVAWQTSSPAVFPAESTQLPPPASVSRGAPSIHHAELDPPEPR